MKKILVPLLSLIVSFNAYGEWTWVAKGMPKNNNVKTYYVDFASVKINGNVFNWELVDYLKPDKFGDFSAKLFYESDCNIPQKRRLLSDLYYTQAMGEGSTSTSSNKPSDWSYMVPDSIDQTILNSVCAYASQ